VADREPPRYRTYRGGRKSRRDDALADRLSQPHERAGADAPRPRVEAGSPIVLPKPGAPPPPRRGAPRPPAKGRRRRRIRLRRILAIGVPLLLLGLAAWVGYGYLQFRDAIAKANHRVGRSTRAALTPDTGSILTSPTDILVLGSDRRPNQAPGDSRSDSIMVVRSDPGKGLIAQLSIPRDLRVEIPGHGTDKINAAYAEGGPALAIRTVRDLLGTGVPINHVMIVDFSGFKRLIDALGGVTIDNPEKIVSNSFDGYQWRFAKGKIHLDGRHALAYSRVRENTLNPGDTDVTRGLRQQAVLSAITSSLASPSTLLHLPSVGRAIGDPLSTDVTANQMLELGWRRPRVTSVSPGFRVFSRTRE
jgi:LCP family protein required for cell wall assembly